MVSRIASELFVPVYTVSYDNRQLHQSHSGDWKTRTLELSSKDGNALSPSTATKGAISTGFAIALVIGADFLL